MEWIEIEVLFQGVDLIKLFLSSIIPLNPSIDLIDSDVLRRNLYQLIAHH